MAMNICRVHVFLSWFKRFQVGRNNVEDDSRSSSKTDENFERVGNLVRSYCRLSICAIAESIGIDKECVRQIRGRRSHGFFIKANAPAHSALSVKRSSFMEEPLSGLKTFINESGPRGLFYVGCGGHNRSVVVEVEWPPHWPIPVVLVYVYYASQEVSSQVQHPIVRPPTLFAGSCTVRLLSVS
ncbi:hypothetical protein O3M35_013185 [Rhynocoris fuscipes]|uniref:Uncharacterized protein n=1 Tax=Rhynocoris fuscipes TaxID=488301 RepID=A0AAW1CJY7_9HEMI